MKASLKIEAGSPNRIISIPSKEMNGYEYIGDKNKKLNNNNGFNCNNDIKYDKENYISNNQDINKNYKLIIDDRNINFGKNASTSEYIGPGSYDIYIKEKGNSVLQWSKSFNLKDINNKKELLKRKQVFDEMKKYGETINNFNKNKKMNIIQLCKTNSSHFLKDKLKKGLINMNNKKLEYNINKKSNSSYYSRDSFIQDKSEIPGPGYYSKELINYEKDNLNKKGNEKEEKKIFGKKMTLSNFRKIQCGEEVKLERNFGSNCGRFLVKSKSMEDLGPTTYFKEKNKFEPNIKPDIFGHLKTGKLINSNENRNFYFQYEDKETTNHLNNNEQEEKPNNKNNNIFLNKSILDNPGPGSYELSQTFILPSFYPGQLMNNQVERFHGKEENNPGPGTYFNENIENEKIQEKMKKIINYTNYEQDIEKINRIQKIKQANKKRNDYPGAGTYNPGIQNTIDYKMKAKFNPRQSYQSPFLISSGRFNYYKDEGVSPTIYDPYKYDKNQKNLQYMVFGKAKRFEDNLNFDNMKGAWNLAGPGSYDLDKNNWNKKTYNKLFSGTQ